MTLANSMVASLTSNLEYALYYSSLGWEVFPAHTIRNGRCSCGKSCKSPGKHPVTRYGLKEATTDRQVILKWWNKIPDANIAIRTGIKSGLVVLDIDTKTNGFESLATLENNNNKLPETLTSITGSKGNHVFFTHPGGTVKTRANILSGIDFRGDGGYIIAPPSIHLSGDAYYWANFGSMLTEAPGWLLNLVNNTDKPLISTNGNVIVEGSRNSSLMSIAGQKWSQGVPQKKLEIYLLEENQIRCKPPLDSREVSKIIESVCRYKPGEPNFKYSWMKLVLNSQLPAPSKHLLLTLSYHMDSKGRSCYPTQNQLHTETSMTIKTIRKHMNLCKASGFIETYTRKISDQDFWNYGYIAKLPD